MLRRVLAALPLVVALLLAVIPPLSASAPSARVYLPVVFAPLPTPTLPAPASATPTQTPTPAPSAMASPTPTPTPTVTATPSPSNVLVNPGFEQGFTGWTVGGAPSIATFAHSGGYSAYLGGYSNSTDGVGQFLTIPACATSATLAYWVYPVAVPNAWDYTDEITMDLRNFNAYPWPVIATTVSCMGFPPVNGPWQEQQSTTGDLTAYRGHVVAVELDETTGSTSLSGSYVDDVLVTFAC